MEYIKLKDKGDGIMVDLKDLVDIERIKEKKYNYEIKEY